MKTMTVDEIVESTQQALKEFPTARIVTMGESTYAKIKASAQYQSKPVESFCGLSIRVINIADDKIFLSDPHPL